ncbi:MAG: PAS domain S-box protein, partial [Planctomycetia bacterium]|nr:PAS domain S-box protein [Planctomycetia bacterium]
MTDALRLMLVEDDDDVALMISKALEHAGHTVTRCRTAAQALTELARQPCDLVLLDHYLPDMPGLELLQALQQKHLDTPALIVTAYGDEQLATRVLHAGALDYVVKDPALNFLAELPKRVAESVTRHRLQQFNRLLIEALESAGDGILITDRNGTILHVNRALERMTGYARQELLGQNPRLLTSGVHPPEVYQALWQAILAGSTWQGELTDRRKDGSLYEMSQTVSPIVDGQGQVTHFIGIQRDITERKQLERQLAQAQKLESIGTLAAGIAHEFNNLLAGITGYASLAQEEAPSVGPGKEFLQQVLALSERAATLTRQLLAFARKPLLLRRPSAVDQLLCSTAELVTGTLRREVKLELPPQAPNSPPLLVEADTSQLQQALVNLAQNSHDALSDPAHPIVFRLRLEQVEAARPGFPDTIATGDYVVVDVADGGQGMPAEVLSQALDPFFTTKDVGRGTGLGLPVAYGIIHAHQGFLTIQTEVQQGTCVSLWLP